MQILHISDTHGKHRLLKDLPSADVLVHTGDFCDAGTMAEAEDFIYWLSEQPYRHKIFIAGNHDDILYQAEIEGLPDEVHYLCNSSVTIDGIKFYGIPMFLQDDLDGLYPEMFRHIPNDTDVLLTHQPPFGILDFTDDIHFGDPFLLTRVQQVKPKLHLFGHIHKANGIYKKGKTSFSNASLCEEKNFVLLENAI